MKRFLSVLGAVLLLALLILPSFILASPAKASSTSESSDYVPGELIVKFKNGVSSQSIQALHSKLGAQVAKKSKYGWQVVKLKNASVESMMLKYKADPNVAYAEPN